MFSFPKILTIFCDDDRLAMPPWFEVHDRPLIRSGKLHQMVLNEVANTTRATVGLAELDGHPLTLLDIPTDPIRQRGCHIA